MGSSPNHESRNGTPISLIGLHTEDGKGDDEGLKNFLDNPAPGGNPNAAVSYHEICDADSHYTIVDDDQAAWCILSGNKRSLNLCFAGSFASWDRATWLANDAMLRIGAGIVKNWCDKHGIPPVHLPFQQVWTGKGIIEHHDWTIGAHDGTHTDCGPGFPWDIFLSYVTGGAVQVVAPPAPGPSAPQPTHNDPSPALVPWNFPAGEYFGNIAGPNESHGGASDQERSAVRVIQQAFIALGCVPGVHDWRNGWADGRWEDATDEACRVWFATCDPRGPQQFTDRLYADDYAVLNTQ
jgi:hypothetical protein